VLTPLALVFTTTLVLHRRSQAALEALANNDALTGLANRRVLLERGSLLNQRRRDDPPRVAVLMIDIDHFKRVNDSFGHRAGESILQQVAHTMTMSLRANALLARYGGEEFGALVPVADETQAREVAERLRAAVAKETYLAEGHSVNITVSVGMTVSDLSGERFDDLLRIADRRVYRAKSNGRNQVVDSESLPA
jgi:diguanylate cyclase (GGDEF)-like protein